MGAKSAKNTIIILITKTKNKMKHNSVTTIKCRFSNSVHKLLTPNIDLPKSKRWRQKRVNLTDAEKIQLFDQIVALQAASSEEISSALYKRRKKKRVEKARMERGYVAKKKTKKEDHEANLVHAE